MNSYSQKYYSGSKFKRSISKNTLEVINPSNLRVLGSIAIQNKTEVNKVISNLKKGQFKWKKLSALERSKELHNVANRIDNSNLRELAKTMSQEVGKPITEAYGEIANVSSAIRYFAEMARNEAGNIAGTTQSESLQMETKEPMGISAHILPFNFPILIMIWTVAASLAAGNSVIIKPSEQASFTSLIFMKFFNQLSANVVSCLTGDATTGKAIIDHKDVNIVSFTGSAETAKKVYQSCAENFKPCHLEGGGSDYMIISDKTDIDFAATAAITSSFHLSGQICTSTEHILVHSKIYNKFKRALTKKLNALRVGDGLKKNELGPLSTEAAFNKAKNIINDAANKGALITCHKDSDHIESLKGYFICPAIIEKTKSNMLCEKDEMFAPFVTIEPYIKISEAVKKVNKSQFGLGFNMITKDLEEAHYVSRNIETGLVWINNPLIDNDALPFGGLKKSGIGRELGKMGLDAFRQTKMVIIDNEQKIHEWWYPYSEKQFRT